MNVRTQPDIDATCQIAREVMCVRRAAPATPGSGPYWRALQHSRFEITPIRAVGLRVAITGP